MTSKNQESMSDWVQERSEAWASYKTGRREVRMSEVVLRNTSTGAKCSVVELSEGRIGGRLFSISMPVYVLVKLAQVAAQKTGARVPGVSDGGLV